MGAVEDTRKLAHDFLAPELREIKARIEALEATTKRRFEAVEETSKTRFDSVEESAKWRYEALDLRIRAPEDASRARFNAQDRVAAANHAAVMQALNGLTNYAALAERLSKLESERTQQAH